MSKPTIGLINKQLDIMEIVGFVHSAPHMDALMFSGYTDDLLTRLANLAAYARSCTVMGFVPEIDRIDEIVEGKL